MIFQLFRYDFIHGIIHQWKKYIVVILITIFSCALFVLNYQKKLNLTAVNFSDLIFWNFRGMKSADSMKSMFITSNGVWLMLNFFLSLIVGVYIKQEMSGMGQQILMKSGRKCVWWFSKCVWCIFAVLIYYFIIFLTVFIISLYTGGQAPIVQLPILQRFVNQHMEMSISNHLLATYMLQMMFVSIAISMVQMMICITCLFVLSFLFIGVVLVNAIFMTNKYSVGNMLMLIRDINQDISSSYISIICIVVVILTMIFGSLYIKKRDIREINMMKGGI